MIRFIDLFAGIGGIRIPFDELGYQCVFSSEWDKAACDTYAANFGERPAGDITKIPAEGIPSHDLLWQVSLVKLFLLWARCKVSPIHGALCFSR